MDMTSFEELALEESIFGEQLVWLQEGMDVKITRVNDVPVLATLPLKVLATYPLRLLACRGVEREEPAATIALSSPKSTCS